MGERLRSLDVLRGWDMFWIIGGELLIHGAAGVWPGRVSLWMSNQFGHVAWDGFTFYDLIFPLFIFLAGMSFPFAMDRRLATGDRRSVVVKVVRRAVILVVLGVVYNNGLFRVPWSEMRYPSVLGRIGVAYLIGGLLAVFLPRRRLYLAAPVVLVGYWLVMAYLPWPGLGPDRLTLENNLVGVIDRALLPGTLYFGPHDPEGLLSSVPAAVSFIAGVAIADLVRSTRSRRQVSLAIAGFGLAAIVVGLVWNLTFPINKNLWSSSFVCLTSGLSALFFLVTYALVDLSGVGLFQLGAQPFEWIGRNPILIYLAPLAVNFEYATDFFFAGLVNRITDPAVLFLVWSACLVVVKLAFLWFLDRRRIHLRV